MSDPNIKCPPLMSAEEHRAGRDLLDRFESWRGGRESHKPEEVPAELQGVTNELRSHVYMYEEFRDKPERTTYYISDVAGQWYITNWLGNYVLARAEITKRWRDRNRNLRYSIRTTIPNLGTYTGQTEGPGMYINLRRIVA